MGTPGEATRRDLTVDGVHTYYVGAAGTSVLVHNCLTYVTYTKTNPVTGKVYAGRARGIGDPAKIVAKRDSSHHMTRKGYGKAQLDVSAKATKPFAKRHSDPAYRAIRGREQLLIDKYASQGKSGNAIRAVQIRTKAQRVLASKYRRAAVRRFGKV